MLLPKTSEEPQTERMATPQELYALKRIAEMESAIAELVKTEPPSDKQTALETASPCEVDTVEVESAQAEVDAHENSDTSETAKRSQGGWLLELASILDQHRIWVETGGEGGTKADLCGVNLENADLTGVNLQGAFLQRANLRGADLSMANLRHASLVQADLCNANLLGTELRGANLMGATLYGAEGLWLGRLGGAN